MTATAPAEAPTTNQTHGAPTDGARAASFDPALPFTVAAGLAAGLTPSALRQPRFVAPRRGVRVPRDSADDLATRCAAALLGAPPGAVVSHLSALRLLDVEVPWRLAHDARTHMSVPAGPLVPRVRGQVTHTFAGQRPRHVLVPGPAGLIPSMHPAAVWRQLAGTLSIDELVVLGDAMTRREQPTTTLRSLRTATRDAPSGTRGIARMRRALELIRPRTDSSMESRTRLVLVHGGLPCPAVNHTVSDDGRFVALVDMAFVAARVAVEYDGDAHRTDARTWRRDVARKQALEDLGWRVVTATADDVVRQPEAFAARVARILRSR